MLLAHGVGGRQDLPIPFSAVLIGAALALLVSFVALGALWKEPRLGGDSPGARSLPAAVQTAMSAPAWRWVWRIAGLVAAAYFCIGLIFGPDQADNPTAGAFYVLFWVGLVPLSLLFGPVWRRLNPLRTLHLLACRGLGRDPELGLRPLPPGVGYWPACAGLFAFVWLELVAPERATLPVIGAWLAAYAVLTLAGAVVFGSRWFDHGDPFEVYSGLVGRLAPAARRGDGVVAWRNSLDGMAGLRPAPGQTTLVVVLLGSTMYDSLSNAPVWVRFVQESAVPAPVTGTAGLVIVIALVLAAYRTATALAGRWGAARPGTTAGEIAHSIVPIAVGYIVAHYYTLFLLEGQRTIALLSDPLDTGADWLGTAGWTIQALGTTPAGVATLQVTVIVIGHVLGTVLAHDRALALFPRRTAVLGQIPLLVLMVVYTVVGLLLLFAA
ncbi:hypothetical protein [Microbispora bryophytorum]|uniref:Fenitrothion hydrolase n=1 Tax=Microbispora bryophytorum TaxID=1460882 RepID=A0A8H9H1E7_9ACTN|nr:hypothetical protein [Microbispora bryophytorum]MBD3136401.1 hypothetical protein [Microbispora bryophytorum]TQS08113.1 hypothetical protein FLX07_10050 [Microbispora bryophytorum]GGO06087.1 hypothetical protein GCM10011574_18470 [Microbispora bryophytorum]